MVVEWHLWSAHVTNSRDRLVVSIPRCGCGCGNWKSNLGNGNCRHCRHCRMRRFNFFFFFNFFFYLIKYKYIYTKGTRVSQGHNVVYEHTNSFDKFFTIKRTTMKKVWFFRIFSLNHTRFSYSMHIDCHLSPATIGLFFFLISDFNVQRSMSSRFSIQFKLTKKKKKSI